MSVKQKVKQVKVKQKSTSKVDTIKWGLVVLLFLLGFSANYYYIQQPLSLRIVGWIILSGLMGIIAIRTIQGRHIWKFFREAQIEMKKVVWPGRRETFQTTLIVIAIVIAFSLIVWIADMFLMWLVNLLTGQIK